MGSENSCSQQALGFNSRRYKSASKTLEKNWKRQSRLHTPVRSETLQHIDIYTYIQVRDGCSRWLIIFRPASAANHRQYRHSILLLSALYLTNFNFFLRYTQTTTDTIAQYKQTILSSLLICIRISIIYIVMILVCFFIFLI